MPISGIKDGTPANKHISESVTGLPTGDSCDWNIFIIGDTHPHCRPYVRTVKLTAKEAKLY